MPASKANQRAVNKYKKNNYDRIEITAPKGRRDEIKAHAEAQGESMNGFINRAIFFPYVFPLPAEHLHTELTPTTRNPLKYNECTDSHMQEQTRPVQPEVAEIPARFG